MMDLTIIGTGYVGLTSAVLMASFNHNVICLDDDKEKVALLKQGIATLEEPNLQVLLSEASKHLRFTTNVKDAIRPSKIIVIAIETKSNESGAIDLTKYYEVLDAIADNVQDDAYIIIRSTVPLGTNTLTKQYLEEHCDYKFEVISFPFFISQGSAIYDSINPHRLVIGLTSDNSLSFVKSSLATILRKKTPTLFTTPNNAELIKLAANSYLAMRLSFTQSLANLCEKTNTNLDDVMLGISLDPRIGATYLKPTISFGGPSLLKDTNALLDEAQRSGVDFDLLKSTTMSNKKQAMLFVEKILSKVKTVNNQTVAILGLSFKANTDDVTNSVAIDITKDLLNRNANVNVYDPLAEDNFKKIFSRHTHIKYVDYPQDALKSADIAIILNATQEIKDIKAQDYITLMRKPIIFDGCNIYKLNEMVNTSYYSLGRPDVNRK